MKTTPRFKTIRIPLELYQTIETFTGIAGVTDGAQEFALEYLNSIVEDTLRADAPYAMMGLGEQLLECYQYTSEAEKDKVEAELFAEVRRRRPVADIIPFHQAPRMVMG